MRTAMYVCSICHRRVCATEHLLLTWTTCQVCKKATECVECAPRKMEDFNPRSSVRNYVVEMYRHTGLVDYPKKKKEGP